MVLRELKIGGYRSANEIHVLTAGALMQTSLETVSNSLEATMLIKTGSGNGDLENSQSESGVPGETGMVSVVAR